MAERKKLAIIDGKSVFYRGYYAMPNLSTKDGTPTGGVHGFAAMALELVKRLKPDYVCVAWDKPKTNIRKRLALYADYKAGRKPAPPDFYAQIPILHELLEAFHWPLYELDDYEADDIMGTLACAAAKKDIETMLITSDLDVLQLVDPHIHVYALKRGFTDIDIFKPESFEQKYGIKTTQFLDLKALKGDSSDNIPGVPGIGEKTALDLLKQYNDLDNIYDNLDLIKNSVQAKLKAGKDLAYLSRELAEIWTDAPIELNLSEMDGSKMDTAHLQNILQRLEFRSLLRQLPENMRSETPTNDLVGGVELTLPKLTMVESDKVLNALDFSQAKQLYIHSRSAGKHGREPLVLMIGTGEHAYVLNIKKISSAAIRDKLSPIFENKEIGKIGYEIKNDIKFLKSMGIGFECVEHDVLVGAFLINPLGRIRTITELASDTISFEGAAFEDLPTEDFMARAPEFIAVIKELYNQQLVTLKDMPKVLQLAKDIEWPVIPVLAGMEYEGIKLDVPYLHKFAKQLDDAISDVEQKIYGHADQEFNISSPSQLADVLFTKLLLPTQNIKKLKTGYSTAASELDKLRGIHPVIDLITQYREVTKLKNTYVDTLPNQVDDNSRVHTTFNMTMAQTGRLSSIDPNLQNIPVRTELGKKIRTAFVADKGNVLVSADYSQQELRIAAVIAGDKGMLEAFNRDEDIHILTAAAVRGIKPEEVTKDMRYQAKAVNFGILYGQGPHALALQTGLTFAEAKEFIDKYFEVRPKLREYIDETRKKAVEVGYVETIMGRRRPTPDAHSSNFVVREAALRAAVNMPIQGTAADLSKLAMIEVNKKMGDKCTMLLQIHDSILVECPEKEADSVSKMLQETMEGVYELPVKLKVDISIGKNWGEL